MVRSWIFFSTKNLSYNSFLNFKNSNLNIYKFIYFSVIVIQVTVVLLDLNLGALKQFLEIFYVMGIATIYFLSSNNRTDKLEFKKFVNCFYFRFTFFLF